MFKRIAPALVFVLAGCGGGGATTAVPGAAAPTATAVPTTNPAGWQSTASLRFSFRTAGQGGSSAHRRATGTLSPKYVAGTTNALNLRINSVNGSTTLPSWVPSGTQQIALNTAAGGNCTVTAGTETCTVTIPAPPGTVNYTFTAVDTTSGYDLSTQTGDQTFAQGTSTSLAITLQGIVNSVAMTAGTPTLDVNGPVPLTVTPYDADGNAITGNATYANTFVLTDPDATSTSTYFFRNGSPGTHYAAWTVSEPSDIGNLAFDYTGMAINSFAFSVTGSLSGFNVPNAASGVACVSPTACTFTAPTPDAIALSGTTVDTDMSDTTYDQPTLFFAAADDAPQIVTATETAFTGSSADSSVAYGGQFALALDPASCGSGATAVASADTAGPATSFTITPHNVGVCKATMTETGTGYPLTNPAHTDANDGVFYISVTSSTLSANGHRRR
jgi:hypothetical protein